MHILDISSISVIHNSYKFTKINYFFQDLTSSLSLEKPYSKEVKSYKIEMKKKVRNPLISIDFNVTKSKATHILYTYTIHDTYTWNICVVSGLEIVCFRNGKRILVGYYHIRIWFTQEITLLKTSFGFGFRMLASMD